MLGVCLPFLVDGSWPRVSERTNRLEAVHAQRCRALEAEPAGPLIVLTMLDQVGMGQRGMEQKDWVVCPPMDYSR